MVMTSEPAGALAAYVRARRVRAGLSQEALAERAGLTIDTVGRLERGLRRRLFPQTVRALADALDLRDAERDTLTALASGRVDAAGPSSVPATPTSPADAAPDALPASLTSFVGRERELTAAGLLVARGVRLLTFTGPGGVGKTRLAIEGARAVERHFPDGVWFVELAPLIDPALVPQTVAGVLGVREGAGRGFTDSVVAALRD